MSMTGNQQIPVPRGSGKSKIYFQTKLHFIIDGRLLMNRDERSSLFKETRLILRDKTVRVEALVALLSQLPSDSDKARGLRAKIHDRLKV